MWTPIRGGSRHRPVRPGLNGRRLPLGREGFGRRLVGGRRAGTTDGPSPGMPAEAPGVQGLQDRHARRSPADIVEAS